MPEDSSAIQPIITALDTRLGDRGCRGSNFKIATHVAIQADRKPVWGEQILIKRALLWLETVENLTAVSPFVAAKIPITTENIFLPSKLSVGKDIDAPDVIGRFTKRMPQRCASWR